MILKLSIDLPEEEAYVAMTRRISKCVLESIQVGQDTAQDMEIIVGELCNNVVLHANGGRFRMDLEYFADRVAVTVTDQGDGFTPQQISPPGTARTNRDGTERYGGFGLLMVQKMADYLTFEPAEPKGMAIRAEKKLFYDTPAAERGAQQMDSDNGSGGGNVGVGQRAAAALAAAAAGGNTC